MTNLFRTLQKKAFRNKIVYICTEIQPPPVRRESKFLVFFMEHISNFFVKVYIWKLGNETDSKQGFTAINIKK